MAAPDCSQREDCSPAPVSADRCYIHRCLCPLVYRDNRPRPLHFPVFYYFCLVLHILKCNAIKSKPFSSLSPNSTHSILNKVASKTWNILDSVLNQGLHKWLLCKTVVDCLRQTLNALKASVEMSTTKCCLAFILFRCRPLELCSRAVAGPASSRRCCRDVRWLDASQQWRQWICWQLQRTSRRAAPIRTVFVVVRGGLWNVLCPSLSLSDDATIWGQQQSSA